MKYVVIAICILIIALAVYLLTKNIIRALKGRCCEGCKHCPAKGKCDQADKK